MIEPIRRQGKYNYATCLRISSFFEKSEEWVDRVRWYMSGQYHKPNVTVQEVLGLNSTLFAARKNIDVQFMEEIVAGARRVTINKLESGG